LASLIFENKDNLNYVNAIVHPEVQKDFIRWKGQYKNSRCIAIESAILFESGFDKITDVSINVSAPLEKRMERIQMRDQISRKDILNRIENQMSEDERIRKADYTITNDDRQALLPQIKKTLKQINY
jgi:dephospho-CoA kinase